MAAPIVQSDEELFQLTGSWEEAAALRDQQNIALNEYNWSQPAAPSSTPDDSGGLSALAPAASLTYSSTDEQGNPIYEPVAPTAPVVEEPVVATPTTPAPVDTGGLTALAPTPDPVTPAPFAPAKPTDAEIVKFLTDNPTVSDADIATIMRDTGLTATDIARAASSKVEDITARQDAVTPVVTTPAPEELAPTAPVSTPTGGLDTLSKDAKNWPTIIPASTDEDGRPLTVTTTSDGTPFYLRDEDGGGMYQNPATVESYKPITGADGKTYYAIHAPTFSSGKEWDETPITGYMTEEQFRAFQGGSTFGDALTNMANSPVGQFALGVLGPYGKAINAVNKASQGDVLGALTTGLGAAEGFGVTNVGGLDIGTAKNLATGANAIKTGNVPGLINSAINATGISSSIPTEVKTGLQIFNAVDAYKRGDTAGVLDAASSLTGSSDAKVAAAALRLVNAASSTDPTAIANAAAAFNNTMKTASTSNSAFNAFKDVIAAGGTPEDALTASNQFETALAGVTPTTLTPDSF